jgi:hypothetical protein
MRWNRSPFEVRRSAGHASTSPWQIASHRTGVIMPTRATFASAVAELLEWRLGALDERRAAAIAEDVQAIGEKGRAPSRRKK